MLEYQVTARRIDSHGSEVTTKEARIVLDTDMAGRVTFAPRLRDFPDRRLACFGSAKAWPNLSPLIGRPINEEVIRQHWGDIMRLASSFRDKSLKPSEILRELCGNLGDGVI